MSYYRRAGRALPGPLAALLVAACASTPPASHEDPPSAVARAAWIEPARAERYVLVTLPAEIEAAPDGRSALAPRLPLRITAWLVAPGDRIAVGEALARVEGPSLDGLRATERSQRAVRDARAAQRQAGLMTQADVALAEADLATADAQLRDATRAIRSVDGQPTWVSPVAGIVGPLTCPRGSHIDRERACLTVEHGEALVALVRVPERHVGRLDGATGSLRLVDGRVIGPLAGGAIEGAVDAPSRTVALRFALPAELGGALPGMSGRLQLRVDAPVGAVVVPESALTVIEDEDVLFVREGEAEAHPVPVERLGLADTAGEIVVLPRSDIDGPIAWRGVFALKSALLVDEDHHE